MISGSGGQGAALLAKLVCYSAIKQELKVVMTQTYGIEQRGGDSTAYVIVNDQAIGSPIVESDADISIALSSSTYENCVENTVSGGIVFYNSSLIDSISERNDVTQIPVGASDIAAEAGSVRSANIAMLGAVVAHTDVLSRDTVIDVIKDVIGAKKPSLVEMNLEALRAGFNAIDEE